jgi:hypothetical protein
MRVRVNFTIEFDPEQYRECFEVEDTNEEIRAELQSRAMSDIIMHLSDEGVRVTRYAQRGKE